MSESEVDQGKSPPKEHHWRALIVGIGLLSVVAWFGRTHPSISTSGWGFLAVVGVGVCTWFAYDADEKQRS